MLSVTREEIDTAGIEGMLRLIHERLDPAAEKIQDFLPKQ